MTEALSDNTAALQLRIANWLAHTRDVDIAIDSDQEQASRKALKLRQAIIEGNLETESLTVDEDLKETLSALVSHLVESEATAPERLRHAGAVCQFINRLTWTDDPLAEKRDLLLECAEIGWAAIRLLVEKVTRHDTGNGSTETHPAGTDRVYPTCQPNRDSIAALIELLRHRLDSYPSGVAEVSTEIYGWFQNAAGAIGLSDETCFGQGEVALLAGGAYRHLGKRDDATRWLDRAEVSFRTLADPTGLARVSYARLCLRHEMGDYGHVLAFLPPVRGFFEHRGMLQESMKCRLLEAVALKQSGRREEALSLLERIHFSLLKSDTSTLAARILAEIGDLHQLRGETAKAMASFSKAIALLGASEVCLARADLKMFIGAAHWGEGQCHAALKAFQSSLADYAHLKMVARVAYMRLYIADTLLDLYRPREAEREILAALPTIEAQKMVPEGFAAVALLKESVRRRKTDPNALRELREHLQASK